MVGTLTLQDYLNLRIDVDATSFYLIMSAVYLTPDMRPNVRKVLGFILLVLASVSFAYELLKG